MYVDDMKLAGKKQNLEPMLKLRIKDVDLGEPTSFLDHVYLDALNDNAKQAKILWTFTEPCSNREVQRVGTETSSPSKYSFFFIVL